jgi:hypothetical protein
MYGIEPDPQEPAASHGSGFVFPFLVLAPIALVLGKLVVMESFPLGWVFLVVVVYVGSAYALGRYRTSRRARTPDDTTAT